MKNKFLWFNGKIYMPLSTKFIVKTRRIGYVIYRGKKVILVDVRKLEKVQLVKRQHQFVRDLLIFQYYTGLDYIEMVNLTIQDIWIDKRKLKGVIKRPDKQIITLTQRPIFTIKKYRHLMGNSKIVFPQYSIQKYYQYVIEISK